MDVIFFLAATVLQFVPYSILDLEQPEPMLIQTSMSNAPIITEGTPVFAGGVLVGKVTEAKLANQASPKKAGNQYEEISLHIFSKGQASITKSTVALVASPLVSPKKTPMPVIELVNPKSDAERIKKGRIKGFSSYEDFWRAG